MPILNISSHSHNRNLIENVRQDIIFNIDTRLEGKNADISLNLYSNLSAAEMPPLPHIYTPNPNFWASDIAQQFTGVHMGVTGGWAQSYGLFAITPRHVLSCAHGGPPASLSARYVDLSGNCHDRKLLQRAGTYPNDYDSFVYLLNEDLPDNIYITPFLSLTWYEFYNLLTQDTPVIGVSQGNKMGSPTETYNCPNNRKAYILEYSTGRSNNPLRYPFYHNVSPGDSGNPAYYLVKDKLYLENFTSGVQNGHSGNADFINGLIVEADALQGISTGYTVTTSTLAEAYYQ